MDVEKVVKENNLPTEAVALVDSIAYQFSEAGYSLELTSEELKAGIEISKRYEDPVKVLRLIDNSIPEYLERRKKQRGVGSLVGMNKYEKRVMKKTGTLNMRGLESRIETEFYDIDIRIPVWGGWGGPKEDSSPGQSNAIRNLEGG